jgi:16S rRNA (cytosine967-C5)-methyltransferase
MLRPEGLLVYSTCTISPTENERLTVDFLDSHPEFALDDLASEMPQFDMPTAAKEGAADPAVGGSTVMTLPHRDDTAGFFIARLRRR